MTGLGNIQAHATVDVPDAYADYISGHKYIHFLAKPVYEPGDKPRFDKGVFNTTTSVSTTLRRSKDGGIPKLTKVCGASGAMLSATWEGGNKDAPNAKV